MKYKLAIIIALHPFFIIAQPYIEGGKTRHRFAQLNVGLDANVFLSKGSNAAFINSDTTVENYQLKNQFQARLIIGGTHFWGHADFYIAIPIASFNKSGFSTGVETGAKYFPWRIKSKKIRPYIGTAILPTLFQQGEGTALIRFKYPLITGLVFNYKKHLLDLEGGYNYNNTNNYYISTTMSTTVVTQPFWISLGYKFMIETTLTAEKDWQSGRTKKLTDTLSSLHRLNGLTIASGPSTAFFLKSSKHNANIAPYIDNHKNCNAFPEFGVGYYLHNPDLQFNVAYRNMKSEIEGYEFSQTAKRKALTLETYKFICDYHGFAAFIGPALSYEWLNINELNTTGRAATEKYEGIKPGISFGWDIRPNRLQIFYLRTNLRYFPNLNVKMNDGKNVPFDQLEFNFIQLVVFPGRIF